MDTEFRVTWLVRLECWKREESADTSLMTVASLLWFLCPPEELLQI